MTTKATDTARQCSGLIIYKVRSKMTWEHALQEGDLNGSKYRESQESGVALLQNDAEQ